MCRAHLAWFKPATQCSAAMHDGQATGERLQEPQQRDKQTSQEIQSIVLHTQDVIPDDVSHDADDEEANPQSSKTEE